MSSIDLTEDGPVNKTEYLYTSVTIDKFFKYGWTVPLKNKNARNKKDTETTKEKEAMSKKSKLLWG